MASLKVRTNLSASPFDVGWYGNEQECLMPLVLVKSLKSAEVNWGPMSETICSGMP